MFSRPTGVINMIHKMHLGQFAYASEEVNGENFQDTNFIPASTSAVFN